MKTNTVQPRPPIYTHEGAPARHISPAMELRRSVMSCLLWEQEFYEDGATIADRIALLIPQVEPEAVAAIACEARDRMNLRHVPLWVVREMARHPKHKVLVATTLAHVIQRADEPGEFLSLYWKDGKEPISAQAKKGLAQAFGKFDAYRLSKYNRKNAGVSLKAVLELIHPKPKDAEQSALWKQVLDGTLEPAQTWEHRLSEGGDKRLVFEDMLEKNELGTLALLRNLRNMKEAGVNETLVFAALENMNTEKVLPFRFIAAARHVPQWESRIEVPMLRAVKDHPKLHGNTVLLVDVSGSMDAAISQKSDLMRVDAATGLAILARELCDYNAIYSFSNDIKAIPDRHGFALRDAINTSQIHSGTYLGNAVNYINAGPDYDRLIVITDEQSADRLENPKGKGYVINVASAKNGIGYGAWTHIDGWSEAIFDYIQESEQDRPQ